MYPSELMITPDPVPRWTCGPESPKPGNPGICGIVPRRPRGIAACFDLSTTSILTTAGSTCLATLINARDRSTGEGNWFCCPDCPNTTLLSENPRLTASA